MKKPKISDLSFDKKGTLKIRESMVRTKKIKITINIDEDILKGIKLSADKTGTPYQTLLNRLLRKSLASTDKDSDRLDRLEREVALLRKKISA